MQKKKNVVVEAGAVSSFLNWLGKTASKGLSDSMNNLIRMGIEVENAKKADENGGFLFLAKGGNNNIVKVKCIPLEGREGRYDVFVKNKGGEEVNGEKIKSVVKEYHDIPDTKFDDCLEKFFNDVFGEGLEEGYEDAKWQSEDFDINEKYADERAEAEARAEVGDVDSSSKFNKQAKVNSSKRLKVRMQKVVGSKKPHARLIAIEANYDPAEALTDVRYICSDPDFVGTLSDAPEQFTIQVEPDGDMDVVSDGSELSPEVGYAAILSQAYRGMFDMQYIHWNILGDQFQDVHRMTDDYVSFFKSVIDMVAEIYLETSHSIPHPLQLFSEDAAIMDDLNIDSKDGAKLAADILTSFGTCLDLYYVNFSHDVQSLVDEWIRYCKKQAQFLLTRMI